MCAVLEQRGTRGDPGPETPKDVTGPGHSAAGGVRRVHDTTSCSGSHMSARPGTGAWSRSSPIRASGHAVIAPPSGYSRVPG